LLKMQFDVEKPKGVVTRGDYHFIELPESNQGLSSYDLVPMPLIRKSALSLGYPLKESYRYTFIIPDNYSLVNPVNIDLVKPGIGNMSIQLKQSGNEIVVLRSFEITNSLIPVEKYTEFKELTDKWVTKKYRRLILKSGKMV